MKRIENEIAYLKNINNDTAKKYIDFLKSFKKIGDEYVTAKDIELTKQFEDDYDLNIHHEGKVILKDEYILDDFISFINDSSSIFYASTAMFEDDEEEYYC